MNQQVGLVDMSQVDENDLGGNIWVPAGRYMIYIAGHEFVTTAAQGLGMWVTYQITEGEHAGKQPREFFNLRHPTNTNTVKISTVKLKQITIACGLDGNRVLTEEIIGQWYGNKIVVDLQLEESDNARYPDPSSRAKQFFHPDHVPTDIPPPSGIIPAKGAKAAADGAPPPPPMTGQASGGAPPPPAQPAPQPAQQQAAAPPAPAAGQAPAPAQQPAPADPNAAQPAPQAGTPATPAPVTQPAETSPGDSPPPPAQDSQPPPPAPAVPSAPPPAGSDPTAPPPPAVQ